MAWGAGMSEADALLYYQHHCSAPDGDPDPEGDDCSHHDNGFDDFYAKKTDVTVKAGESESKSFRMMTGSEKIVMLDGAGEFNLQTYADGSNGGTNALEVKTSLDYLLGLGDDSYCNLISCYAFDAPMLFEILFTKADGESVMADLLNNPYQLVFHMSPERGGLSVVSVPAAAWLFGTALIGLVGFGRKRKAI